MATDEGPTVRIEFWNGQQRGKGRPTRFGTHVTTKHNPCLWTDIGVAERPWRAVYEPALNAVTDWETGKLSGTDLLHHLRYVAYGLGKRSFDDADVVWPGNLTTQHRPCLNVWMPYRAFSIRFSYDLERQVWNAVLGEGMDFYWDLSGVPADKVGKDQ